LWHFSAACEKKPQVHDASSSLSGGSPAGYILVTSSPTNCFIKSIRAQGGDTVLPTAVGIATQWPFCLPRYSAPAALSQTTPDYLGIIAAPDRSGAHRKLDTNRAPAQWLAFIGAKPGMKVLDIFAVYGWKAELLARAVAPDGKVYAQNSEAAFARVKARSARWHWLGRLAKGDPVWLARDHRLDRSAMKR
jgi:hypothetical protein